MKILQGSPLWTDSKSEIATLIAKPKQLLFLSSNPTGNGSGNKSSKNELIANSLSFKGTKNFLLFWLWILGSFLLNKPNWVTIFWAEYFFSPLKT